MIGLFNKIAIQADYFREYRSNILMDRAQIPATMGLQSPIRANVGEASSNGYEITMDYNDQINDDLYVGVRANFSYADSRYEVYEELDYQNAGLPYDMRQIQQVHPYVAYGPIDMVIGNW